ncbi:MAG: tRNA glutamyl-Q(34) synthetase GluQRS [Myxococcota bacterium]
MSQAHTYRGRFAPSPSGPLHFGSLVAAVASYAQARHQRGAWLVRIDDVDGPREVAGASALILQTLEAYGFVWDELPVYQSQRGTAYQAALDALVRDRLVYGCTCSRREVADSSARGIEGPIYPGTCRHAAPEDTTLGALRLHVGSEDVCFEDHWQGRIVRSMSRDYGDFVLRRADGVISYHLACVVDDAHANVTEVVRGADLLESTPRQILLYRLLGLSTPRYGHVPIAMDAVGDKLSKQTHAPAIRPDRAAATLVDALRFLGQNPPRHLALGTITKVWEWAIAAWRPEAVPSRHAQPIPVSDSL